MKKHAFTLLEVIIVLGFLIVLVSMLWSLLQVYSSYYVSGTRRVERSQLVRSISQLLDEDLSAAIQDPIHPLAPSSEADDSVRRFGLLGTNTTLRVDVIQINPLDPTGKPTAQRRAAMGPVQNVVMQVPELKTIFYDFVPLSPQQTRPQYFGLVRREISFETPDDSAPQSPGGGEQESSETAAVRSVGDWSLDRGELLLEPLDNSFSEMNPLPDPLDLPTPTVSSTKDTLGDQLSREDDPNRMWAPEVVEFSLRYSDGQNWHDSWDSIEKNGLPLAVEVKLALMPLADIDEVRKSPLFFAQNTLSVPVAEPMDSGSGDVATTRAVGTDFNEPASPATATITATATTKSVSWKRLTEELGIVPPKEQRIVVFLAGSPLLKNEPFRRPAAPSPPVVQPPSVSTPAPTALTTGPEPTLITTPSVAPPPISPPVPSPSPPKPVVPSQQWIRK